MEIYDTAEMTLKLLNDIGAPCTVINVYIKVSEIYILIAVGIAGRERERNI